MKIDAHQHFWRYSPEDYPWIGTGMERIARDFLVADLEAVARPEGIGGSVAVQARQSLAETRWLLELAAAHPFIRGVVGWVDLRSGRVGEQLAEFAGQGSDRTFVGVRHGFSWARRSSAASGSCKLSAGSRGMPSASPTTCSSTRPSCRRPRRWPACCPSSRSSSITWRSPG